MQTGILNFPYMEQDYDHGWKLHLNYISVDITVYKLLVSCTLTIYSMNYSMLYK